MKIENNQVTSIYSDNSDVESEVAVHEPLPILANDEITSFFNRKLPNKEWTDNLSSLANNYEVWTSTACKLKSLVPLYGEKYSTIYLSVIRDKADLQRPTTVVEKKAI